MQQLPARRRMLCRTTVLPRLERKQAGTETRRRRRESRDRDQPLHQDASAENRQTDLSAPCAVCPGVTHQNEPFNGAGDASVATARRRYNIWPQAGAPFLPPHLGSAKQRAIATLSAHPEIVWLLLRRRSRRGRTGADQGSRMRAEITVELALSHRALRAVATNQDESLVRIESLADGTA